MRLSAASALLGASLVSGAVIPNNTLAAPTPLDKIPTHKHKVIQPAELFNALKSKGIEVLHNITAPLIEDLRDALKKSPNGEFKANTLATAATCTNPRQRTEWDSYSQDDRHAYVNAINCLRSRPASGQFPPAGNRYEDLVRLHQSVTPNVHDNAKFLVWHRYFMWVFEDILRTECGFDRNLPWWDEGRNTGRFAASSVFSGEYYGAIAIGGACVSDGVFSNSNLNIGPGDGFQPHCLSRAGDSGYTGQINEDLVNAVNSWPEYRDMAYYAEGTYHAYGHLGVGGVQADKYASPGDPWFFLHHAYVDRNFANWQGGDANTRTNTINGNDINGNPLTMDTIIYMNGLRPDIAVREIMNVLGDRLCYTYQY
ncbi:Di-copper centre-containing protein [Byssothecium circinans]|uniref:Di-copper centre-containing protein n=1 Tax=Byssothecium circinans TaxID=147558 RepID=A0A6A5TTZ9_9PLEO|nr:Di-copper centre-containing protein [Byssothecium circinans]